MSWVYSACPGPRLAVAALCAHDCCAHPVLALSWSESLPCLRAARRAGLCGAWHRVLPSGAVSKWCLLERYKPALEGGFLKVRCQAGAVVRDLLCCRLSCSHSSLNHLEKSRTGAIPVFMLFAVSVTHLFARQPLTVM